MSLKVMTMKENVVPGRNSLTQMEDGRLILLTCQGNTNCFGVIVERYRARAVRVASSIVGDIELARDLTQDAFVKAYRSLGTFDLNASFLPWFYRILKNLCVDHLRRKARWNRFTDLIKTQKNSESNLMDEIQQADTDQKIREAVASLKPNDREIIELKHFAGFGYDEISKILGIPKGTVMSRLYYARKALKEKLELSLDWEPGAQS